ncbi:MAG TPA: ATP-binding domain-containing protein [Gammaproteobacteria bacterium]
MLCFNRPLADRLAQLAPNGTTVNTYLGFCTDRVRAAGIDVEFGPDGPRSGTWQHVQEQLIASNLEAGPRFDCLVVDEGQDFESDWFEILQLFLTEDAAILWLEDPRQDLRGTPPVDLPGFARYRETANFRSPQSIGRYIRRALGVDMELRNPLPGLGVRLHEYEDERGQQKILAHRINELVKLGFTHDDIAVVSCRGVNQAVFAELGKLGSVPIRRFTGQYDDAGQQIYTDGKLTCDTIFHFKGQQAPAVVLADIDESLACSDRTRAVLYCGMTRATVRLEMLVHRQSPLLPELRDAI